MWTRILLKEKSHLPQPADDFDSSCKLEFADWSDLEEHCLLLSSHLGKLTVIDYPLQLIIQFSFEYDFLVDEAQLNEQIEHLIPVLALIQILASRCLTFNVVSNNQIFEHLFPEFTSQDPELLHIGLGIYLELPECETLPIVLSEFIREMDFIEKTKLDSLQADNDHKIVTKDISAKEGIYKGLKNDYYCIYNKKGFGQFISFLPPFMKPHITTPPTQNSQQISSVSLSKAEIKNYNKSLLKKLLLPTMKHAGCYNPSSFSSKQEFKLVWKQLYCGCAFALRKDFCRIKISQDAFVQVKIRIISV
jgi:hypothetical protein